MSRGPVRRNPDPSVPVTGLRNGAATAGYRAKRALAWKSGSLLGFSGRTISAFIRDITAATSARRSQRQPPLRVNRVVLGSFPLRSELGDNRTEPRRKLTLRSGGRLSGVERASTVGGSDYGL